MTLTPKSTMPAPAKKTSRGNSKRTIAPTRSPVGTRSRTAMSAVQKQQASTNTASPPAVKQRSSRVKEGTVKVAAVSTKVCGQSGQGLASSSSSHHTGLGPSIANPSMHDCGPPLPKGLTEANPGVGSRLSTASLGDIEHCTRDARIDGACCTLCGTPKDLSGIITAVLAKLLAEPIAAAISAAVAESLKPDRGEHRLAPGVGEDADDVTGRRLKEPRVASSAIFKRDTVAGSGGSGSGNSSIHGPLTEMDEEGRLLGYFTAYIKDHNCQSAWNGFRSDMGKMFSQRLGFDSEEAIVKNEYVQGALIECFFDTAADADRVLTKVGGMIFDKLKFEVEEFGDRTGYILHLKNTSFAKRIISRKSKGLESLSRIAFVAEYVPEGEEFESGGTSSRLRVRNVSPRILKSAQLMDLLFGSINAKVSVQGVHVHLSVESPSAADAIGKLYKNLPMMGTLLRVDRL